MIFNSIDFAWFLPIVKYKSLFLNCRKKAARYRNIHPIIDFTSKDKRWKLSDIPVFKFNWLFYELLKLTVSEAHRKSSVEYGQYRSAKCVPDESNLNFVISKKDMLLHDSCFIEMIDICKRNKSQLLIVDLPATLDKTTSLGMESRITKNIEYLNFNTEDKLNWINPKKDWLGGSHLNVVGAEKFTRIFRDSVLHHIKVNL
jgi:hypothetical protein